MMNSMIAGIATIVVLCAVSSSPGMCGKAADAKRQGTDVVTEGAAVSPKPETLRGVIDSVDQGDDTVSLRLSPQTTEQFRVQDGFVFNSVRYGDEVEVTVQDISGAKTIVGLKKQ